MQADDLKRNTQVLTTAIYKHGEHLHNEIGKMIKNLKSDIHA